MMDRENFLTDRDFKQYRRAELKDKSLDIAAGAIIRLGQIGLIGGIIGGTVLGLKAHPAAFLSAIAMGIFMFLLLWAIARRTF